MSLTFAPRQHASPHGRAPFGCQALTRGDTVEVTLPWSEVCMHLRVADRRMAVRVLDHGMAQLLDPDGSPFSAPITMAEAGFHRDDRGWCYQPA